MADYRNADPNTAPLVRVEWEDIVFLDSWDDSDGGSLQPQESTTVGYLILDTPTMMVIADSYNWRDRTWATIHTLSKVAPQVSVIKGVD